MSEEAGPSWVKRVGLFGGVVVFLALAFLPSGLHALPGFGHRPAYAAAVAALMATWWFTEALPIAWTALVPLLLFPLLGVFGEGLGRNAARAAEPFADAYIFLFMGGMAIGAAMEEWNLHRRIALRIMQAIGTNPARLLVGMLVATAVVSLWISNTATAVMMLPIAMALLSELEASRGGKRLGHFGAAIMLAVAYASNVGGMGTKIGTATNSIFAGFLSEKLGYELGFLQYMAAGFPFVLLFLPLIWWVLWRGARKDAPETLSGKEVLDREVRAMGRLGGREALVAWVFGGAAALWIFGDVLRPLLAPVLAQVGAGYRLLAKHYEAGVAMSAAAVLVSLRALSLRSLKKVPWGTLVLLGGSFSMAAGIEASGLSSWMTQSLAGVSALPWPLQVGLSAFATVAISAVASNTATVNLMLNVLPRSLPLLTTSALAASCDFALPAGTPPNAIVFGSGYIRLPTMMRTGALLDLAAASLLTLYGAFYLPLLFP